MEKYLLDNDIPVFYVQAQSFPDGIKPAFEKLHSLLNTTDNRRFFGISYAEKPGKIIYRAAVEENHPGEGKALGCETFTIRKGYYISTYIQDFMKDIPAIGKAFEQMLKYPNIDPGGYCLEIYGGMANVRCLVLLKA
ncbi:MAG TPA: hypothetical protein VFP97_01095 [Chitinophagaceae bacterium]|nr:hypothetical protein [Chitinophagaceae bacterium]